MLQEGMIPCSVQSPLLVSGRERLGRRPLQLPQKTVPVGDVRCLRALKGKQQTACKGAVAASLLDLSDDLSLPHQVSVALGNVPLGQREVIQQNGAVLARSYYLLETALACARLRAKGIIAH